MDRVYVVGDVGLWAVGYVYCCFVMAYCWFRFSSLVLFYFFICLLDLIAVCVGTLASWRQVQRGDDRRVIRWLFPTARRFVDNTLCAVGLKVVGQQDVVDSHSGVSPEQIGRAHV